MPTKDEILEIGIDVDIKAATKEMAKFQKSVLKHMQSVTVAINKMGKVNEKMTDTAVKDSEEWAGATDDMGKAIETLEKKLTKAGKEEARTIKGNIKLLKGEQKQRAKAGGGGGAAGGKGKSPLGDPKEFGKQAKEEMKDAADAFKGSLSTFFGKDLKGTIEGLGKGFGKTFGAAAKAARPGERLKARGAGMRARGEEMGGMKGRALKAGGGAMGGMGKLLGVIGKIGPLLSVAASTMMAVVKLFIDAEAAAMGFQKGILESTGNVEFLAAAGGNAGVAFLNLQETVEGVRDAAFQYNNLDWGITADTHKAVLNTLNQEGVSLKRMADEAGRGRKAAQEYASELVHVNVAYSRAFGVSLSEIGQMQGEMMSELGMSLDSTKLAFTQMARSATESGIASNKFFAMIRGVSQDLSLYNLRIEDAAKLLGKLGKVMNPRNAAQFMSTLTGFMKGLDIDSRFKMQLLGGKKASAALNKDLKRKATNLNSDISAAFKGSLSPKEVSKALSDPQLASEMWRKLRKVAPPGQAGALRGSASELKTAQIAQGKGAYGRAVAMKNMDAVGSLQTLKASLGVTGKGTLQGARGGLGFEKFAQMLSVSEEMLAGMIKFETALEDQRYDLLAEANTKEQKDKIRAMDESDLLNSMTAEQKKAVESSSKIESLGEEQARLQQSFLDKMETLINFMMNQLFNVMMGIWDAMPSLPGLGGAADEAKQKARVERGLMKSKDKELRDLAGQGLSLGDLKEALKKRALGTSDKLSSAQEKTDALKQEKWLASQAPSSGLPSSLTGSLGRNKRGTKAKRDFDKEIAAAESEESTVRAAEGGGKRANLLSTIDWSESTRIEEALRASGMGGSGGGVGGGGGVSGSGGGGLQSMATALNTAGGDPEKMRKIFEKNPKKMEAFLSNMVDKLDVGQLAELAEASAEADVEAAKTSKADVAFSGAIATALTKPGTAYFKFSDGFFSKYQKGMGKVFLDSLRTAFFEFWQYSALNRETVAEMMAEKGMSAKDFAKQVGEDAAAGKGAGSGLGLKGGDEKGGGGGGGGGDNAGGMLAGTYGKGKWKTKDAPGAASGLMITGQEGEIARVRSLGNEALVGAKPGEVVGTPDRLARAFGGGGGGGGTVVELRLKGDAKQLFEAIVVNKVHDMQRRSRSS